MTRTDSSAPAVIPWARRGDAAKLALLDLDGVIVHVDRHWRDYCLERGGDPAACGVGVSYLQVCERAAGDPVAAGVAAAIRVAVRGERPAVKRHRLASDGENGAEWFDVLVTPRFDDAGTCLGAAVVVVPVPTDVTLPTQLTTSTAPELGTPDMLAVLDIVGEGVVVLDARTLRRLYVNRADLDRIGYTRPELRHVPLGAPATPEDGVRLHRSIRKVIAGRAHEASIDINVRHRSGTVVPVEIRVTYRPSSTSRGHGLVVLVSRDLRERLVATERLRRNEESFRAAFDQLPIGMAVCRLLPDGGRVIALANPALGRILGVPSAELAGRDLRDFTPAADEDLDRAAVHAMYVGKRQQWSRRKRYVRPDGSQVWTDASASLVEFPAIGGVTTLAHFVDVTRTRELEIARVRRAALASLAADVSALVLGGATTQEVHHIVVRAVPGVFDAVGCALLDLGRGRRRPVLSAAWGSDAGGSGLSRPQLTVLSSVGTSEAFADDQPFGGPAAVVRFPQEGEDGLLLVRRASGAEYFTPSDLELLAELADRISTAVQLGLARQGQHRVTRLEERQRIARDLHDTVIQDLIAVGMRLDSEVDRQPDAGRDERCREIVTQLDDVVQQLREAVFTLGGRPRGEGLELSLQRSMSESARVVGFTPTLRVSGPVQDVAPAVAGEVLAVLREALSNIARHARATSATVRVTVRNNGLTLTIEDDGVGIREAALTHDRQGNGLANISERAQELGGASTVSARPQGGTRLRWHVPLHRGHPVVGRLAAPPSA